MDIFDKLTILADAAKYDVACTSSGAHRRKQAGKLGNIMPRGCCHSFSADGRCISLLKVLQSNICAYDCCYCINRKSNDIPRTSFTPRELADLTIGFYRRNYIEGLFLSSAVVKNPNYTCELMLQTLRILRLEYEFKGYIHAKIIPGADISYIRAIGFFADRLSVNIELPSEQSLRLLAPDKSKKAILQPMEQIRNEILSNRQQIVEYQKGQSFSKAGQSTQLIVGATPENDYQILKLASAMYRKYALKRVFFSAYIPLVDHRNLPSLDTKPPLLREHRLYQADWLLRFYGFEAEEILDEQNCYFNPYLDPKSNWALKHMEYFPVEINKAPYNMLLRIPGVGITGARNIMIARKATKLDFTDLKKMRIVLKRAKYFITCKGKMMPGIGCDTKHALEGLILNQGKKSAFLLGAHQLSFFEPTSEDM